jgi:hypothetical protein
MGNLKQTWQSKRSRASSLRGKRKQILRLPALEALATS